MEQMSLLLTEATSIVSNTVDHRPYRWFLQTHEISDFNPIWIRFRIQCVKWRTWMTATAKWLLSNHWTGRFIIDVEIARRHFQIFDSLFQKCPLNKYEKISELQKCMQIRWQIIEPRSAWKFSSGNHTLQMITTAIVVNLCFTRHDRMFPNNKKTSDVQVFWHEATWVDRLINDWNCHFNLTELTHLVQIPRRSMRISCWCRWGPMFASHLYPYTHRWIILGRKFPPP